jgi:hypothetical protein
MEIKSLGEVIAERRLSMTTRDGRLTTVTVKLGKPVPFDDGTGYYAPFQITGTGPEKIKYAGGVDAIQAVQLAMKMIGANLHALSDKESVELEWEAGDKGDLGFPF